MASLGNSVPAFENLRQYNVTQLKDVLRNAGLKTSGSKSELIKRILASNLTTNGNTSTSLQPQVGLGPSEQSHMFDSVENEIEQLKTDVSKLELQLEISRLEHALSETTGQLHPKYNSSRLSNTRTETNASLTNHKTYASNLIAQTQTASRSVTVEPRKSHNSNRFPNRSTGESSEHSAKNISMNANLVPSVQAANTTRVKFPTSCVIAPSREKLPHSLTLNRDSAASNLVPQSRVTTSSQANCSPPPPVYCPTSREFSPLA